MKRASSLATSMHSCGIDLAPGGRYRRRLIHDCVGGQQFGGISTPKSVPSILIFTGPPGEEFGYKDRWIDHATFLYTGEGQVGDMELVRGNRAICDHKENRKELHLFEIESKGYVQYIGEMERVDHEWWVGPDVEGKDRRAIRFRLRLLE